MSFQKNKYIVVRKTISLKLAKFITQYFLLKRKVARKLFDERYISQFTTEFGVWNDDQVPETYSHYADIAMETLLTWVQPIMEKHLGYKLSPTYSYARIYKKGDILKRHKDRFSCEVSTTLNLGGDLWSIYLGCELEHWREAFQGKDCVQVFLHYNKAGSKKAKENEFDKRPYLGLPSWFKK